MLRTSLTGIVAFALGILATLVLLELALRMLPVCKGGYGAEPDSRWPAHHLIPNSDYTFSTGWDLEDVRRGHINNMGYVAPFDYQNGSSAVVVLGDSFIEDQMTAYAESLQGSLPGLLEQRMPVLGFGTSGGTLPHDLGVAALIGKQFRPLWGVILITRGNFVGGFRSGPGYYRWTSEPEPGIEFTAERRHSTLAQFLRGLSLVAYARSNLRADFSTLFANRSRARADSCHQEALSADDQELLAYAAEALPQKLNLPPSRVIWVFDADRQAIYAPDTPAAGQRCQTREELGLRYLSEIAAKDGMNVIDMEPVFRAQYQRTGEHFDYLPVDGHWNGIGHNLAAREVARYINGRGT